MSVGILLVTHGKLGHFLLDCMRDMIGELPLTSDVLEVRRVQAHEVLIGQGSKMIERLNSGDGVLVLTDAFGSTPSNIANKLCAIHGSPVVSGVNLPMLVRVYNYPRAAVDEMAKLAVEGGQRGIILCPKN
ncbi:PTS system ascorbate-specific IIA component [Panacagrimonas perspica]|uniref:PTS system ascorbate-specific IIA component n=1 Tax=Panacagrimonas perspica TaxID=381431 RepID=A0A4S3K160_9GAMM|nr:PTS fructose transporter subunit IIA [Panacagrimonas perspica]TDU30839.1 PTS system ascorbate-specific IIA component [Panacagrimonas perspica]THD01650.1 PTS fructose transporter subunit IIA [Panacagrimonas perspica]